METGKIGENWHAGNRVKCPKGKTWGWGGKKAEGGRGVYAERVDCTSVDYNVHQE